MANTTNYFAVQGVERFSATTPHGALEEYIHEHGREVGEMVVIEEWRPAIELLSDLADTLSIDFASDIEDHIDCRNPEALDPEGDVEFLSAEGSNELVLGMQALLWRVLSRHATVFHCERVGSKTYNSEELWDSVAS